VRRRLDMRESIYGIRHSPAQRAQLTLTPDVVWDRDFGSRCASCIAMVQATDHREGDDLPPVRRLALAEFGGVLVEREVGPGSVMVLEVLAQDAPQVLLSENDDVVEAVPPKGPDHALAVRILPRRPRRGEDLLDPHRTHSTNEVRAIDLVSVPDDVPRRRVVGEGVDQLLACPLRGRTIGDVEVHDAAALVLEEHVQDAKRGCGNDKEVDGNEIMGVIPEKRTPGLRRRLSPTRHVPRHRGLCDVEAEHEQLTVNTWRSPRRVLAGDSTDERPDLRIDRRTSASMSALPCPVELEALAMPADHGLWLHDDQGVVSVWPQAAERDPECGNVNDCAVDEVLRRHRPAWGASTGEITHNAPSLAARDGPGAALRRRQRRQDLFDGQDLFDAVA
jgi:hypothetical protein